MSGKAKGYWLAAVAALTCPCHIPILILALSGTAAGALLADNLVAALAIMTVVFLLSLRSALRAFDRPDKLGESR